MYICGNKNKTTFTLLSLLIAIAGFTIAFTGNFIGGSIIMIAGSIIFLAVVDPKPDPNKCTSRLETNC